MKKLFFGTILALLAIVAMPQNTFASPDAGVIEISAPDYHLEMTKTVNGVYTSFHDVFSSASQAHSMANTLCYSEGWDYWDIHNYGLDYFAEGSCIDPSPAQPDPEVPIEDPYNVIGAGIGLSPIETNLAGPGDVYKSAVRDGYTELEVWYDQDYSIVLARCMTGCDLYEDADNWKTYYTNYENSGLWIPLDSGPCGDPPPAPEIPLPIVSQWDLLDMSFIGVGLGLIPTPKDPELDMHELLKNLIIVEAGAPMPAPAAGPDGAWGVLMFNKYIPAMPGSYSFYPTRALAVSGKDVMCQAGMGWNAWIIAERVQEDPPVYETDSEGDCYIEETK